MKSGIYKIIDEIDIVSFDIFDTLLWRPYIKASDMFIHLEEITRRNGFAEKRQEAESLFYQKYGYSREVTIDDIYAILPEFIDLKERELNLELQILNVNFEIKKYYDYAKKIGKKIIICSDMYLPVDFLEKVLKKNGYGEYDKLYVSNAINRRKDRGDMYDYVLADLKVKPSRILHIGDNKNSDYKNAIYYGLKACHYLNPINVAAKKCAKLKKLIKIASNRLDLSILISLYIHRCKPSLEENNYWENFGYFYGGSMTYAYCKFIYNQSKLNNIAKILFIARDGYLLQKVFNIFYHQIKTYYIYAPRILNYTTNLDFDWKSKEQARIVCNYFNIKLNSINPCDYILKHIDTLKKLSHDEKKRSEYKKYLESIVKSSDKCIAVVDSISGQLSGQKLISKEIPQKILGIYFLTLKTNRNSISQKYEHCDYLAGPLRDSFVLDAKCDLVELILSSPEKPIITIRNQIPIFKHTITHEEKIRQDISLKIEKGVLSFANDLKTIFNDIPVNIHHQTIFDLFNQYVACPEKEDFKALQGVMKSVYADNCSYTPLLSDETIPFYKIKQLKEVVWATPLQKISLFLFNPIKIKIRGCKSVNISIFPYLRCCIFKISFFNRWNICLGNDCQ